VIALIGSTPENLSEFLPGVGDGRRIGTRIRAGAKTSHPPIQASVGTAGAAQVLAFRAVGNPIVPGGQLQGGLTAPRVERRRTFLGGDPPLFFHTCLLFAADITGKTFNPSH
jgi:hypothetical protein